MEFVLLALTFSHFQSQPVDDVRYREDLLKRGGSEPNRCTTVSSHVVGMCRCTHLRYNPNTFVALDINKVARLLRTDGPLFGAKTHFLEMARGPLTQEKSSQCAMPFWISNALRCCIHLPCDCSSGCTQFVLQINLVFGWGTNSTSSTINNTHNSTNSTNSTNSANSTSTALQ